MIQDNIFEILVDFGGWAGVCHLLRVCDFLSGLNYYNAQSSNLATSADVVGN